MVVENRFKIHALNTVNSARRTGVNKFYPTYEEAEKKATEYAQAGEAMVIYEAKVVIEPAPTPVIVTPLKQTKLRMG